MDKKGGVESLYTRIPNDEDFLEQDCLQIDVDKEVEEPNELSITCLDEELDGDESLDEELDEDESLDEELDGNENFEETKMISGNEKVEETKMINGNEKVEEPTKLMTFNSHEEVISYYKAYAMQVGFAVLKRVTKKSLDGTPYYMVMTCARDGKVRNSRSTGIKIKLPTNRTKCNARICANLWDNGMWYLSKVVLEHNHPVSPKKVRFHRCYKNINIAAKKKLDLNDRAGICLNKNFNSLVVEMGGFENVPFDERDARNFINKARELRLGKGGGQALFDYFVRMRELNDRFYYVIDMDDDSRLRNVFWADARSRASYEYFGDVITFDTTYLTNRYDMPFAPFVGVNHHGQSILFGAGLLSNEDTDTFVWLFEAWLKCMNYKTPNAIITDQDRAMKNAIETVFPKTRHRYCLWHIMRKVPEKLSGYKHYDDIKMALNRCVYDSPNVDDFEENWKSLIESYELQNNPWLNILYSERTFWVPAYMKDMFWAGMTTTQRSESMNSFFDNYVHAKTTLKEFVDQFDNALKRMVEREARADFDCYNRTSPCVTDSALEKQFQDAYTNAKFKEVQAEFKPRSNVNNCLLKSEGAVSTYRVIETNGNRMLDKTFSVFFNNDEFEVKCTCALFELRGIICRHSISVLLTSGVTTLPPRYILDRWRKDINRKHVLIKSTGDLLVNNSIAQRYNEFCKHCEELASLTSKNVKYFMEAMRDVDMLTEKYRALTLAEANQCDEVIPTCDEVIPSNEGTTVQGEKVLTPVKATKKGRPRVLRMVPVIEKVTKKSKGKVPVIRKVTKKSQGKKSQGRNKQQSDNTVNKKGKKKKNSEVTKDDLNTSQTSLYHTTQGSINAAATMVDPKSELSKLISQHKYEEAFAAAFRICDVSIVYWLCSQVDLHHILSIYPLPLSQVVLLHLLRHLTYGININMPHTFGWMISVANAIIPTDPLIAMHVQPIFNEIYAVLNQRQYLPTITGDELSSIRSLIYVIMSKSM